MKRFIEGASRSQSTLFPEYLGGLNSRPKSRKSGRGVGTADPATDSFTVRPTAIMLAQFHTDHRTAPMSPQYRTLNDILPAMGLALAMAFSNAAMGQNAQTLTTYDLVTPPSCTNNKGKTVRFIDSSSGRPGMAVGMADRDGNGKPVVFRSNYTATPPEFQSFIDRHECAHHQTGDVDRPHPPRNGPEHLMNESISDCIAILRLRDEEGCDQAGFNRVAAAMRHNMAKIGFPEISISSRISNIDNCFTKYGAPQDFVIGILKQRDLLQP